MTGPTAGAGVPRALVQDRAGATRERLLAAAIHCFTTVGYDAASTRQIEAEAGVKRGLIAYHFRTKEVLWKAAVADLFGRVAGDLHAAEQHLGNVDAVARRRYFVRVLVRLSARYPELNRLMVREGIHGDWRMQWLVDQHVRPVYQRFAVLFDEARTAGEAPAIDAVHAWYIVIGAAALMFAMAAEARQLTGLDVTAEAVIDQHANALADMLFPGKSQ